MNLTSPAVRKMLAEAHGPRAAAWLLRQYKKQLHSVGCMDFRMPFMRQIPQWFQLAMKLLKSRPNWHVRMFTNTTGKIWRVTWLGWKGHGGTPANTAS